MIRLIYWLIKRRWAICKECKWTADMFSCYKHTLEETNFVNGGKKIAYLGLCTEHNRKGCCWEFVPKSGRIEPPEPWPKK